MRNMKRWIAGLAVLGLLTVGGTALAAGHGRGMNYVDANGDGVCDNRGTGVCWNDADGDGVCDYYTGLSGRGYHGCGRGYGCK